MTDLDTELEDENFFMVIEGLLQTVTDSSLQYLAKIGSAKISTGALCFGVTTKNFHTPGQTQNRFRRGL